MHIAYMNKILGDIVFHLSDLLNMDEITSNELAVYGRVHGLNSVRRFKHHEVTHIDLISSLLDDLVNNKRIDLTKIKYLMISHTSDDILPYEQNELSKLLSIYSLNNARILSSGCMNCVTIFAHLSLAENIINSLDHDEYIYIISVDITFTKVLKKIPGTTLMSDGAVGLLLSSQQGENQYVSSVIHRYGEYAHGIWSDRKNHLKFQQEYILNMKNVMLASLDKAQLTMDDVNLILPHNINIYSWYELIRLMKISTSKLYLNNVNQLAHCFGSDPFINLMDSKNKNLIKKHDYYLLASAGLGAAFAAAIFKY